MKESISILSTRMGKEKFVLNLKYIHLIHRLRVSKKNVEWAEKVCAKDFTAQKNEVFH